VNPETLLTKYKPNLFTKYEPYHNRQHITTERTERRERQPEKPLVRKYDPFKEKDHPARWLWIEAQKEAEALQNFDPHSYPADDKHFWGKFDDLWNNPDAGASDGLLTSESPTSKKTKGGKSTRVSRSKRTSTIPQEWPDVVATLRDENKFRKAAQFRRIRKITDADKISQTKSAFRKWKRHLFMAWNELEKGEGTSGFAQLAESSSLKPLLAMQDLDALYAEWLSKPVSERERDWPELMAMALFLTPDKAHEVLLGTFEPEVAPFYVLEDVVSFAIMRGVLMARHGPHTDLDQSTTADNLCKVLVFLLAHTPKRTIQLRQNSIFSLLKKARNEQVVELFQALRDYGHPLQHNTLLQFASQLAKDIKQKSVAVEILGYLVRCGEVPITSPHALALCTSILSVREGDSLEEAPTPPEKLFEALLALGIRPNLITYTAVIRNLCLHQQLESAWRVFEIMLEHNISPDATLLSVLINGAKLADNFHMVSNIINTAISMDMRDPVIWNDLLHAILIPCTSEARHRKLPPPRILPAFRPMLIGYSKFFKLEPLQKLVISNLQSQLDTSDNAWARWKSVDKVLTVLSNLPTWEPEERMDPTSSTLAIMLIGYIRGFPNEYSIVAFYSQFRDLLKSGDPVVTNLVREQGSLVYDAIIKAAMEWPGLLRVALDITGEMIKDASITAAAPSLPDGAVDDVPRHPAPSVHTWSILLNGLLYHRHNQQAENVLRTMREYGIEPNQVSWNTLVCGYARQQHMEMTVKTLERLERSGLRYDDFTIKGFGYLRDRERALEWKKVRADRREQAQERHLKRELAEESARQNDLETELRGMEGAVADVTASLQENEPAQLGLESFGM
jgi:pentatricopeptide repeat protein